VNRWSNQEYYVDGVDKSHLVLGIVGP